MNYYYNGKKIGEVKDGVLKKNVSLKRHLFRRTDSWGIDYALLQQLPDETVISIYDKDERKEYRTTKKDYWSKGEVQDWGHGRQVMLSRANFV